MHSFHRLPRLEAPELTATAREQEVPHEPHLHSTPAAAIRIARPWQVRPQGKLSLTSAEIVSSWEWKKPGSIGTQVFLPR